MNFLYSVGIKECICSIQGGHLGVSFTCYVLIVIPPYMDPQTHEYFLFCINGIGTLAFVVISNALGVHCLYCVS